MKAINSLKSFTVNLFIITILLQIIQCCDNYCEECFYGNLCIRCLPNYTLSNNNCISSCENGKFWYEQGCVNTCPKQYFSDTKSKSCRKLEKCINLQEQGQFILDGVVQSIILKDNKDLITADDNGQIFKFDVNSGVKKQSIPQIQNGYKILSIEEYNENTLLSANEKGGIFLWDIENFGFIQKLNIRGEFKNSKVSVDIAKQIVLSYDYGKVYVTNFINQEESFILQTGLIDNILGGFFDQQKKYIYAYDEVKNIYRWQNLGGITTKENLMQTTEQSQIIYNFGYKGNEIGVAIKDLEFNYVSNLNSNKMELINLSKKTKKQIQGHQYQVQNVLLIEELNILITQDKNNIILWDINNINNNINSISKINQQIIKCQSIQYNDGQLYIGDEEGLITIYDLSSTVPYLSNLQNFQTNRNIITGFLFTDYDFFSYGDQIIKFDKQTYFSSSIVNWKNLQGTQYSTISLGSIIKKQVIYENNIIVLLETNEIYVYQYNNLQYQRNIQPLNGSENIIDIQLFENSPSNRLISHSENRIYLIDYTTGDFIAELQKTGAFQIVFQGQSRIISINKLGKLYKFRIQYGSSIICDDNYCSRCTNFPTVCEQCYTGYYLLVNNTCDKCPSTCTTCTTNPTTCGSCIDKYYLNVSTCTACPSSCALCTANNVCQSCVNLYILVDNQCMYEDCNDACTTCTGPLISECLGCNIGYFLSSTTCVQCSSGCVQCTALSNCQICGVGYVLNGSTCVQCDQACVSCFGTEIYQCNGCVEEHFLDNTTCIACTNNCKNCSSTTYCLSCQPDYRLSNQNTCLYGNCHPLCVVCTGPLVSDCQQCIFGYYYANENCIECASPCENCQISSITCTSCISQYYLSGNQCFKCNEGCFKCDGTPEKCTQCLADYKYVADDNTCIYNVQCDSNCKTCDIQISIFYCLSCNDGFYLPAGENICQPCNSTCKKCYGNLPTNCLACYDGQILFDNYVCESPKQCDISTYLNSSNTCVSCKAECLTCFSENYCLSCVDGYFLQADLKCLSYCPNQGPIQYQENPNTNKCDKVDSTNRVRRNLQTYDYYFVQDGPETLISSTLFNICVKSEEDINVFMIGCTSEYGDIHFFDIDFNEVKKFSYVTSPNSQFAGVDLIIRNQNSNRIISVHEDQNIVFWKYSTGTIDFQTQFKKPTFQHFITQANQLITYYNTGQNSCLIYQFDVDSAQLLQKSYMPYEISKMTEIKGQNKIASGFMDGNVGIFNIVDQQSKELKKFSTDIISNIYEFQTQGIVIVITDKIYIFDINNKNLLDVILGIHVSQITDIKYDPFQNLIWSFTADSTNNLCRYDLNNKQAIQLTQHTDAVTAFLYDDITQFAFSSSIDTTIKKYSYPMGTFITEYTVHTQGVQGIKINTVHKLLISWDSLGNYFIIRYTSDEVLEQGSLENFRGVQFDNVYHRIIFYDKNIHLYDSLTGQQKPGIFSTHSSEILGIVILEESELVFTFDPNKIVIRSLKEFTFLYEFIPEIISIQNIKVNSHAKKVVCYSLIEDFETVFIYDYETFKQTNKLLPSQSQPDWVNYGIIDDLDNGILIQIGQQKMLVWDIYENQIIGEFQGYHNYEADVSIKNAFINAQNNELISFDSQQIVTWSYKHIIGLKGQITIFPEYKLIYSFVYGDDDNKQLGIDSEGNVWQYYQQSDQILFLRQLNHIPFDSIQLSENDFFIIIDETQNIYLYDTSNYSFDLLDSLSAQNCILLIYDLNMGVKFQCATQQNKIIFYQINEVNLKIQVLNQKSDHNAKIQSNYYINQTFKQFVTLDENGVVCVWDYQNSNLVQKLNDHTKKVNGVVIDNDNGLLISYSEDSKLLIYQYTISTLSLQYILTIHSEAIDEVQIYKEYSLIFTLSSKENLIQISNFQTLTRLSYTQLPGNDWHKIVFSEPNVNLFAIFCNYQVNIYDIQTFQNKGIIRQPLEIQDIINVEIISENLIFLQRKSALNIIQFDKTSFKSLIYFSLNNAVISYKQFTFDEENQILSFILKGIALNQMFNYQDNIKVNSIQNECFHEFKYNQIMTDEFQNAQNYLSKNNIEFVQYEYIIKQFDPIPYIPYQKVIPINAILVLRQPSFENLIDLRINSETFTEQKQENLELTNMNIQIDNLLDSKVITFSDKIQNLQLINSTIGSDVNQTYFYFNDLESLYIKNLTIYDRTLIDTNLFKLENIQSVVIDFLNFTKLELINSTFFNIFRIDNLQINNLEISQLELDMNSQHLFEIKEVSKQYMRSINFHNIIYNGGISGKVSKVLQFQGLEQLQMVDVRFYQNTNMSLINNTNIYQNDDQTKTYNLLTDKIHIYGVQVISNESILPFSIFQLRANRIIIQQSEFSSNIYKNSDGCIANFNDVLSFQIEYVQASSNIGRNGGVFRFNNCTGNGNYIYGSEFVNNIASGSGGVIISENSNFKLYNEVIMQDNQAMIGGAIRFLEIIPDFYITLLEQQQQQQVVSQRRNLQIEFVEEFEISQNYAEIYGHNIAYFPSQIYVINNGVIQDQNNLDLFQLQGKASGEKIDLEFQIKDQDGLSIKIDIQNIIDRGLDHIVEELESFYTIEVQNIQLQKGNYILDGNTVSVLQDIDINTYNYQLQNFTVFGKPEQTYNLGIYSECVKKLDLEKKIIVNQQNQESQIKLALTFRNCEVGEVYQEYTAKTIKCQQCPTGSFSLLELEMSKYQDQDTCEKCDYEIAISCEGSTINLKNGLWRPQGIQQQLDVTPCSKQPDNCKAEEETSRFSCTEGHIGALCEECDVYGTVWDESYQRTTMTFSCQKCSDKGIQAIGKHLLYLIIEIWFIQFTLKNTIKLGTNLTYAYYFRMMSIIPTGNCAYKDKSPFFIKQFFHYLALSKFCNISQFEGDTYIRFFPKIFSSPVQLFYYLLDCGQSSNPNPTLELVYLRVVWVICVPFIYGMIVLLLYTVYVFVKKKKFNTYHIFNACMFFLMYTGPGIISELLKAVSCRTVGKEAFVTADMSVKCNSGQQGLFTAAFGVPLLLLFIFVIPCSILTKLRRTFGQNKQQWYTHRIKIGFLASDLKRQYFYWEFVRMYKKVIIVTFNIFYNEYFAIRMIFTSVVIFIYFCAQQQFKPYKFKRILNLDQTSMRQLIQLSLSSMLTKYSTVGYVSTFFMYLNIIQDSVYTLYLAFLIIDNKMMAIHPEGYLNLQLKLVPYLPKKMQKYIEIHHVAKLRVFFNWLKLRKIMMWYVRNKHISLSEYAKQFDLKKIEEETLSQKSNNNNNLITYNNVKFNDLSSLASTGRQMLFQNDLNETQNTQPNQNDNHGYISGRQIKKKRTNQSQIQTYFKKTSIALKDSQTSFNNNNNDDLSSQQIQNILIEKDQSNSSWVKSKKQKLNSQQQKQIQYQQSLQEKNQEYPEFQNSPIKGQNEYPQFINQKNSDKKANQINYLSPYNGTNDQNSISMMQTNILTNSNQDTNSNQEFISNNDTTNIPNSNSNSEKRNSISPNQQMQNQIQSDIQDDYNQSQNKNSFTNKVQNQEQKLDNNNIKNNIKNKQNNEKMGIQNFENQQSIDGDQKNSNNENKNRIDDTNKKQMLENTNDKQKQQKDNQEQVQEVIVPQTKINNQIVGKQQNIDLINTKDDKEQIDQQEKEKQQKQLKKQQNLKKLVKKQSKQNKKSDQISKLGSQISLVSSDEQQKINQFNSNNTLVSDNLYSNIGLVQKEESNIQDQKIEDENNKIIKNNNSDSQQSYNNINVQDRQLLNINSNINSAFMSPESSFYNIDETQNLNLNSRFNSQKSIKINKSLLNNNNINSKSYNNINSQFSLGNNQQYQKEKMINNDIPSLSNIQQDSQPSDEVFKNIKSQNVSQFNSQNNSPLKKSQSSKNILIKQQRNSSYDKKIKRKESISSNDSIDSYKPPNKKIIKKRGGSERRINPVFNGQLVQNNKSQNKMSQFFKNTKNQTSEKNLQQQKKQQEEDLEKIEQYEKQLGLIQDKYDNEQVVQSISSEENNNNNKKK